jgi:DNA-binding winged helix-turn-helix (wHTH) protein/TolB-like protein
VIQPEDAAVEHRFGPFTYDACQRLLFRNGEPVPVVPKLIDTLHILLERRGRVVEKSELMRLVWPDAVVEESGLTRNVSLLRKTLGDESEQYIQTVPKRGYRFAAAEAEYAAAVHVRPERRRAKWLLIASVAAVCAALAYWQFYVPGRLMRDGGGVDVAVLPFQFSTPGEAEIGRSFDESLITSLAQVPAVRVLSPSTTKRYREAKVPPHIMARIVGMDGVLEGTIQVDAGFVRVTARLVDVHSGRIVWANRYDRTAAGAEPVQVAIAKSIAGDVGPHLSIQSAFRRARTDR